MSRLILLGVAILALCGLGAWTVYWRATRPSTVTAAEAGDLKQLQALQAKGISLNYHDERKFDWTPLIAATYWSNSNIVAYLLSQKVDLEAKDRHGDTALSVAVTVADKDFTVVKMLLDAGAKTNAEVLSAAALNPQKDGLLETLSRAR